LLNIFLGFLRYVHALTVYCAVSWHQIDDDDDDGTNETTVLQTSLHAVRTRSSGNAGRLTRHQLHSRSSSLSAGSLHVLLDRNVKGIDQPSFAFLFPIHCPASVNYI